MKCTAKKPCKECAKAMKIDMAIGLFNYVANLSPKDPAVLRHIASQVLKLRGCSEVEIKKMLK